MIPAVVLLTALACTTLYPIVFVVFTAFKSNDDYVDDESGIPRDWTLANIEGAWRSAHVGDFVLNSLLVVSASVVLIAAVASLAGYAFAHLDVPLRRVGLLSVVALMLLPAALLIVPAFRVVLDIGLLNTYAGLVLFYTALSLPFNTYLMASYFERIPPQLLQAARVDGASELRAFATVALPLARPGILTLLTLNFLFLWNELLFSLVLLNEESKRTLMVGLALLDGQYTTETPLLAAGLLIALIPPLLVFAFFQRSLTEGITAGAIK
jgi:ABC-type glycerol-3-phosphate transport system permease component